MTAIPRGADLSGAHPGQMYICKRVSPLKKHFISPQVDSSPAQWFWFICVFRICFQTGNISERLGEEQGVALEELGQMKQLRFGKRNNQSYPSVLEGPNFCFSPHCGWNKLSLTSKEENPRMREEQFK